MGRLVAQSVKRPTSAQVMISQFVNSSPASGSGLTAQSLESASDSVSPSLSAPPLLTLCLSLSLKNKQQEKKKESLKGLQKHRLRSPNPRVYDSQSLGCWLGAWSLFPILCLPLSLPLPRSCSVSLCPKKTKQTNKKKKR